MPKKARVQTKLIFVAYAYNLYNKSKYRKVFTDLETVFGVHFIFADEKITNMHILQKIISYIRGSDFSIFDISSWNPNVTLELGISLAMSDNWYICFNPSKTNIDEVPSDIRGIDRIQYNSFEELEGKLIVLLDQWYHRATPPHTFPVQRLTPIRRYRKRILWADDVISRNTILELQERGIYIKQVKTSADAQNAVKHDMPGYDAIITDVERPESETAGLKLVRWLYAYDESVPLVVFAERHEIDRHIDEMVRSPAHTYFYNKVELYNFLARIGFDIVYNVSRTE